MRSREASVDMPQFCSHDLHGLVLIVVGLVLVLGRSVLAAASRAICERIGETWRPRAVKILRIWLCVLGLLMAITGIAELMRIP